MLQVQLNNYKADLQWFTVTFTLNLVRLYRTLTIFNGCEFSDFGPLGNLVDDLESGESYQLEDFEQSELVDSAC